MQKRKKLDKRYVSRHYWGRVERLGDDTYIKILRDALVARSKNTVILLIRIYEFKKRMLKNKTKYKTV